MTNRTIEFLFDADDYLNIEMATDPLKVEGAMGYLMQWNLTYTHVRMIIRAGHDPEIVALYYGDIPEPDNRGQWPRPDYAIGAVWHGDHFGFHS
jgi:hypothetical protein